MDNKKGFQHKGQNLELYISEQKIQESIREVAKQISKDYSGRNPLVIGVLNGVFLFMADLVREFTFNDYDVDFIKVSSYQGQVSTGNVQQLIGSKIPVEGRHVIIVDDILDTGQTILRLLDLFQQQKAATITVCVFVYKPGKQKVPTKPDYCALEIEDKFIVGYGMDLDEQLRGLKDLYIVTNE